MSVWRLRDLYLLTAQRVSLYRRDGSTDCSAFANGNVGCGSRFTGPGTFGTGFNDAGGGWFVIERTNAAGISIYFWSRNDKSVPKEVRNFGQTITPSKSWGLPQVRFPTDSCDLSKHLDAHQIIINLSFCVNLLFLLFHGHLSDL